MKSMIGRPIKPKDPVKGFVDGCMQNADEARKAKGQVGEQYSPKPDSYKSPTRDSPPIFRIEHGSGLVTLPADCAPDEPEEISDELLEVELSDEDIIANDPEHIANDPEYRALVQVDSPGLEAIVDSDVTPLGEADILVSADKAKPNAVKAIKNVLYEDILSRRSEIGISVDYMTTKKGTPMVRYKHREDGDKLGKWVSKEYVKSAVEALLLYDLHMEKGDWKSLKEASSIVSKYFTKDVKQNTLELIEQKLDQEAMLLASDAAKGLVDTDIATEVYSRLRKTGIPAYLGKAVQIAERYNMNESIAAMTRMEYDDAVERSNKKGIVIVKGDSNSEKLPGRTTPPPFKPKQYAS